MVTPEGTTAKAECQPQMVHALEELQRVCQGVTVYGEAHPAVLQAAASAAVAFRECSGMHVLVRGTGLRANEVPVNINAATELLRDRVVSLRIASLVVRATVEPADLLAMAVIMAQAKSGHRWGVADSEELSRKSAGRIEALPINYAGLSILDGAARGQSSLELDWNWISQDLVRVTEGAGGITAAELAARVNSSVDAEIGGLPSEVIEAAAQSLASANPEQRAASEARLTMFFSLLGPNVLQATARIDSARPSRSMQAMFQVAGALSPAPMVEAVEKAEPATLGTPDGLKLLAKLVWLSQDQQRLSARLGEVLASMSGMLAPLQGQADELHDAVKVLEEAIDGNDFATEDYEDLLEQLERAETPRPARNPETWNWTTETARVHAAAIAVDLLADPATPAENLEGAFTYLSAHLDSVIDAGAIEVAFDCAASISQAHSRPMPPAAQVACTALARTICDPAIVSKILVHMRAKGLADQTLSHAIGLCGVSNMIPLLQKASVGKIDLDPSLLVNDPALSVRDLAAELFRIDPQTLAKLAADKMVEPERRARLAHAMLAVEEPGRREAAYRVFNELYETWPRSLVAHALMDDHPAICGLAIAHIDGDASNLHSIGVMLSGGLGFTPDAALFRSGADALARFEAVEVLKHVAVGLLRSPSPRSLKRAWTCWRLSAKCKGVHA